MRGVKFQRNWHLSWALENRIEFQKREMGDTIDRGYDILEKCSEVQVAEIAQTGLCAKHML